ncbi:MAG: BlaI/MecI/CopY family transcriptional regulator [Oscillospiraceae bacterium]|nr:BlaI/MecI/CopY family transcriptional regulator [Oscillospiraceae bacterium]MDE7002823.1 BlaI/MecI/CopY family transcriptional regulator [Oscillospiraceae bacterium]
MKLTRSELEIMETLWQAERPLARFEILEQSVAPSWSPSTIHILLNGLLKKGAIREAGFIKRTKTYGRLYAVNLSRAEYYSDILFRGKDAQSIPAYFSMLLQSDELTTDVVDELEKLLAERRKELESGE